ncbi:PhzF family phenazine biosynthesis protein [Psychrobacter arenosus]|uniref:PhzF family phenazine biosynthesis protein n=1 Tax=Psychrobacter arenosus TaxID=256326 RepID=UPI0019184132|nr:PhzF family phenazine biosynthesis protein [Psychrobacter arenosus]
MTLPIYQVDAFTNRLFGGNPAAVIPLESWLDDAILQAIASENNLSETSFIVANDSTYELRWFMPTGEVDLCGHGTLAAAHVLFTHLGFSETVINFATKSGLLSVTKTTDAYAMVFPAIPIYPVELAAVPEQLAIGLAGDSQTINSNLVINAVLTTSSGSDYIVVLDSPNALAALTPDQSHWGHLNARRVIVTSKSDDPNIDFVSRCLYTQLGKAEDPVTGSAHCLLTPYWAAQLNKTKLATVQVSQRRGHLQCELLSTEAAAQVRLVGQAVDYMVGQIAI